MFVSDFAAVVRLFRRAPRTRTRRAAVPAAVVAIGPAVTVCPDASRYVRVSPRIGG